MLQKIIIVSELEDYGWTEDVIVRKDNGFIIIEKAKGLYKDEKIGLDAPMHYDMSFRSLQIAITKILNENKCLEEKPKGQNTSLTFVYDDKKDVVKYLDYNTDAFMQIYEFLDKNELIFTAYHAFVEKYQKSFIEYLESMPSIFESLMNYPGPDFFNNDDDEEYEENEDDNVD